MVLFVDDTSIIITDTNRHDFNINANQMFHDINSWFHVNLLTLNYNKTQYLEFRTKNYYNVTTHIKFNQEHITNVTEIKFLGLTIDDTLSWKQHIEQLVKYVLCVLCVEKYKTYSFRRHAKSNLFCSYTRHFKLRYNLLGQLLPCQQGVYTPKENY